MTQILEQVIEKAMDKWEQDNAPLIKQATYIATAVRKWMKEEGYTKLEHTTIAPTMSEDGDLILTLKSNL